MKAIIFILVLSVGFVSPLFSQSETHLDHVPGDIMVLLSPTTDVSVFCKEMFSQTGVVFEPEQKLAQSMNLWLIQFDADELETNKGLQLVERSASTIIAQLNHTNLVVRSAPDDSLYNQQWAFDNDGVNGGSGTADIAAEEAWDVTTGGLTTVGDTIVVAVIDGGFDLYHKDLVDNLFINHHEIPQNGIDDDNNGYIDDYQGWDSYSNDYTLPLDNHGTHVAGTVGARGNNNVGVTGVNWNVKVLPIAGSSSLESTVIAAYGYVLDMRRKYNQTNGAEGAYIVSTNASFGVDYGQPENYPLWCAMYDSLGYEGILSAGATANLPIDIDVVGDVPTACSSDFLISVTNTTSSDLRNSGAAWGFQTIDIGAPGTLIYSLNLFDNYGDNTGTSMATPHVAGAIGLMYSAACNDYFDPSLYSNAQLALLMKEKLLTKGIDSIMSMTNQVSSEGRLNLYKSVMSVTESCLAVSGIAEQSLCDSCNGRVDLTLFGMTQAVVYNWSNGATTDTVSDLCAGSYSVTISNTEQDTVVLTFSISDIDGPEITSVVGEISCFGDTDGSISLAGNADYIWSDGSMDSSRAELEPGQYLITATDAVTGCVSLLEIDLIEPQPISVSFNNQMPSASGISDGVIQVIPSGGVSPYGIIWEDDTSAFVRDSLSEAWYKYIITDQHGCTYSDSVYLGVPFGQTETELSQLSIFPNPSQRALNVVASDLITSIEMYDLNGRLIRELEPFDKRTVIELFDMNPGIYFIHVETERNDYWDKIMKLDE